MLPAASTLLDTVTTAARAAILPAGVSTLTSRLLQTMRLAGVDSDSGTGSPSFAISVPNPCRQPIAVLRSCARDLSPTETSFKSLPEKLAPNTNSVVPAQSPRSFGSTEAQETSNRRAASSIARLARTRAARNSSVSPGVAAADTNPLSRGRGRDLEARGARQLDHRIGLGIVHPARAAIERHIKGRSVGLAAAADLARCLHHDHLAVRRHDPPRRSNAGRTRADHDNVGLARQGCCAHTPPAKNRNRCQTCGRRQEGAAGHCHVMV